MTSKNTPLRSSTKKPHIDTPTRARFFEAIDRRGTATKRSIFEDFNISRSTGYRLINERETYGATADRRSQLRQLKRKETGKGSGRPPKLPDEQLEQLRNAPQGVGPRQLHNQLSQAGFEVSIETVRRALKNRKAVATHQNLKSQTITNTKLDS